MTIKTKRNEIKLLVTSFAWYGNVHGFINRVTKQYVNPSFQYKLAKYCNNQMNNYNIEVIKKDFEPLKQKYNITERRTKQ